MSRTLFDLLDSVVSLHLASTSALAEEIGYLRRERDRLKDQLSLTCEEPPYGCDCPGCSEMRRRVAEVS